MQQARVLRLTPATASAGAPASREKRGAVLALEAAACTSHHERVTKDSGLSLAQGSFVRHKPTTTRVARHERAASLSAAPSSLVTASAGAPAPCCDARRWLSAWRCKPRLARRRTSANRMRVASHWRGAVRQLMSRPQPAWHCARAAGSSVAPHPSESERRRTSAPRETRRCFGVGGRSWHVAPRGHAEEKRPLNGTVRLCTARDDDNNQRVTARAFRKLECYASSLVTASAGMHAPHGTWRWCGVGGCRWHVTPRMRTVGERCLAVTVPFRRIQTAYKQRRIARGQQARVLRLIPALASPGAPAPRENCGAVLVLDAAAGTPHHGRAPHERTLLPEQCAFVGYRPPTTSAAWRSCAATSSAAPHPSDSERRCCSSAGETRRCLGVGGRSLRVPYERGLSPARCPSVGYEPPTASATWRARAASSSAAPHPQRQRAQAHLCHAKHAALAWR